MARSFSLVAAAFVFLKGDMCPEKGVVDPDAVITRVELRPDTVRLVPGATTTLTATPYDKGGIKIDGRVIGWQSASTGVATVAGSTAYDAVVTAVTPGTTTVTATISGQSATTTVIVATATVPVARLTLSAVLATGLHVYDTTSVTATVQDAAGNVLTGRAITFTSSDPSVAAVASTTGGIAYVAAKKIGSATLTATSEGVSQSAQITVTQGPRPERITASIDTARVTVGGQATVTFKVFDGAGVELPDSAFTVSSTPPTVLTLVGGSSQLTTTSRTPVGIVGVSAGQGSITARAGLRSVIVPVIVAPAAPPAAKSITISPKSLKLRAGKTATFSATVATATGAAWTGTVGFRTVGSGASIANNGTLSATQPGNVLVIATADAIADTAQVTVFGVDSVRIAPRAPISLVAGGSTSLSATVYGGGQALTGEPIAWSSTNPSVVDVVAGTSGAIVGAKAAGSASVIASSGGKADTVAVTVTAATGGNTLDIHPLGVFSVKKLANDQTQTFNNLFIAGDHEENGDKMFQAYASYLFTGLPTNATVTRAQLTVRVDTAFTGTPFGLGALVVELASGSSLYEGPVATSAIPVATATSPSTVTVDVTTLVREALLAGKPSALFRFRFTQATNGNGKSDYLLFNADPLTLTYTTAGSVRASSRVSSSRASR